MGVEKFNYNPLTGRIHHPEDGHLKRRGWFADLTTNSDGYMQKPTQRISTPLVNMKLVYKATKELLSE